MDFFEELELGDGLDGGFGEKFGLVCGGS